MLPGAGTIQPCMAPFSNRDDRDAADIAGTSHGSRMTLPPASFAFFINLSTSATAIIGEPVLGHAVEHRPVHLEHAADHLVARLDDRVGAVHVAHGHVVIGPAEGLLVGNPWLLDVAGSAVRSNGKHRRRSCRPPLTVRLNDDKRIGRDRQVTISRGKGKAEIAPPMPRCNEMPELRRAVRGGCRANLKGSSSRSSAGNTAGIRARCSDRG